MSTYPGADRTGLELPLEGVDDGVELGGVPVGHQAAVVGPLLGPPSLTVTGRLLLVVVVGQFCRLGAQAGGQVGHASAQRPQQGVGGARVPLEGAALGQHVDVGQALDHTQSLVAGPRSQGQPAGAAQRAQAVLHHLLLAGAQHGRQPRAGGGAEGPGHRAGPHVVAADAPEVAAAPAERSKSRSTVSGFAEEAATQTEDQQ